MSCWRKTVVLRIPASALGFRVRREWDAFLRRHEADFDSEPGCFQESLCDPFPYRIRRPVADPCGPDAPLDWRDPARPDIVPGPFLDYYLDEIMPLPPESIDADRRETVRRLSAAEAEKHLPAYRRLFPGFTAKSMEDVRYCEYVWYDGTNPSYLYSPLD